MKIICKTTLLAMPDLGSVLSVRIGENRLFKLRGATLAEGCDHVTVDWGDGSEPETFNTDLSDALHTYSSAGDYAIRFSDGIGQIMIGYRSDSSDYNTIYAPMVTGFVSNASRLSEIPANAFRSCVNLMRFDVAESSVSAIYGSAFKNCAALSGALSFPMVKDIAGGLGALPFTGCSRIAALRFSRANETAIRNGQAFSADRTLGTGIENVCQFNL